MEAAQDVFEDDGNVLLQMDHRVGRLSNEVHRLKNEIKTIDERTTLLSLGFFLGAVFVSMVSWKLDGVCDFVNKHLLV